jgi:putative FmdB family regulatory protein
MPIYEYRCKKCGSHFEKRQSVSEEPLKVCEHCEGELEKQWSLSGFAFKGEGWYVTDYAKKSGAQAGTAAGGGESSSGKNSSGESSGSESSASPATTTTPDSASKTKSD